MGGLEGRTILMSGGSRGIGLAIALRAAADGANVALLAKTAEPDPRLEGTIFTAAEQIEAAGGKALPVVGDVRDENSVKGAVAATVERFGGIDVCVNNASAINLARSEGLAMKRYDLMQEINARGTFLLSRECVPHCAQSSNPHVLTLSPPFNLDPKWFSIHLGYTHLQVRHEHVHARAGARVRRRRHRLQLALAADPDRHRRGPQHHWRGRGR